MVMAAAAAAAAAVVGLIAGVAVEAAAAGAKIFADLKTFLPIFLIFLEEPIRLYPYYPFLNQSYYRESYRMNARRRILLVMDPNKCCYYFRVRQQGQRPASSVTVKEVVAAGNFGSRPSENCQAQLAKDSFLLLAAVESYS